MPSLFCHFETATKDAGQLVTRFMARLFKIKYPRCLLEVDDDCNNWSLYVQTPVLNRWYHLPSLFERGEDSGLLEIADFSVQRVMIADDEIRRLNTTLIPHWEIDGPYIRFNFYPTPPMTVPTLRLRLLYQDPLEVKS